MSSDRTDPIVTQDAEAEPASEDGLASRAFGKRSVISFAVALAILAFFVTRLDLDPASIWAAVREADLRLVLLAFTVYYSTFLLRGLRWKLLLRNAGVSRQAGVPVPSVLGLSRMIFLSWFANCVIPAKLGDAYRAYQLKGVSGVSFATGMGTVLAERLLDITVLVGLLLIALPGAQGLAQGPGQDVGRVAGGGILLLLLGAAGLGVMWLLRDRLHARLPAAVQAKYLRFQEGTLGSFRGLLPVIPLSLLVWLGEASRLFLVIQALDLGLGFPYAVFLALANSLLTVVPFTPGGLGLVEAGVVGLLILAGVDKEAAVAAALVDRLLSYWSIVVLGFPLFLSRRRV